VERVRAAAVHPDHPAPLGRHMCPLEVADAPPPCEQSLHAHHPDSGSSHHRRPLGGVPPNPVGTSVDTIITPNSGCSSSHTRRISAGRIKYTHFCRGLYLRSVTTRTSRARVPCRVRNDAVVRRRGNAPGAFWNNCDGACCSRADPFPPRVSEQPGRQRRAPAGRGRQPRGILCRAFGGGSDRWWPGDVRCVPC